MRRFAEKEMRKRDKALGNGTKPNSARLMLGGWGRKGKGNTATMTADGRIELPFHLQEESLRQAYDDLSLDDQEDVIFMKASRKLRPSK